MVCSLVITHICRLDQSRTKRGPFLSVKRSKKYSNRAKCMAGKNSNVTHSKDHTANQIESPENGNTECLNIFFRMDQRSKFKAPADNTLNLVNSFTTKSINRSFSLAKNTFPLQNEETI